MICRSTLAKLQAARFGITSRSIAAQSMQSRSKRFWMLSQYCAEVPKYRPRRAAVSAVMPAFLIHDQADAVGRHADRLRQAVDADLFILQAFSRILPG